MNTIETNRFHADLFWIAREANAVGAYMICVSRRRRKMPSRIDREGDGLIDPRNKHGKTRAIRAQRSGRLTIQTRAPLVLDNHDRIANLGRFIIADAAISMAEARFLVRYTDRTIAKSKIYFGPKEKLRDENGRAVWATVARLFGSPGVRPGKSTIRRLWNGNYSTRHAHLRAGM